MNPREAESWGVRTEGDHWTQRHHLEMVTGLTGMVGKGRELGQGRSTEGIKFEARKWYVWGE